MRHCVYLIRKNYVIHYDYTNLVTTIFMANSPLQ